MFTKTDSQRVNQSILFLYSSEMHYCCDLLKRFFDCIFATVKCKSLHGNEKITDNLSLLVLLWGTDCGQVEERDFLIGLAPFLDPSVNISAPQRCIFVNNNNSVSPIADYLRSCGSWIVDINTVFASIMSVLDSPPCFNLRPVSQDSILGRQITSGFNSSNGHGKCWRDMDGLQYVVPWLAAQGQ